MSRPEFTISIAAINTSLFGAEAGEGSYRQLTGLVAEPVVH